jgi:hypothetical protein
MTTRGLGAGVFLTLAVMPAVADTLYTYAGPAYTFCTGAYANAGGCAGTYSLTGSLDTTLSLAQLENGGSGLTDYILPAADIASISFSDGYLASLNQNTATTDVVEISTNGSGDITSWGIYLSVETPAANATVTGETILTESTPIGAINGDISGDQVNTICGPAAISPPMGCGLSLTSGGDDTVMGFTEPAGTWSTPTPTPEPSTLFHLGMGLVAGAAMRFRRARSPQL